MKKLYLLFTLFVLGSFPLAAQDPGDFGLGFVPYQSYHIGDFDSVNGVNNDLLIDIPVVSYPQRGALPNLSQSWVANSPRYVPVHFGVAPSDWYQWIPTTLSQRGNLVFDGQLKFVNDSFWDSACPCYDYYLYHVEESDGATHRLGSTSSGYVAIDGSGISGTTNKNGISGGSLVDPSGNAITGGAGGYVDSVGRTIPFYMGGGTGIGTYCQTESLPGPTGSDPVLYKFCYADQAIQTHFNDGLDREYSGTFNLLQYIYLSNNTFWLLTYDTYGNVSSVTVPTGGKVSYSYSTCYPFSLVYSVGQECITGRTVTPSDPAHALTWTYAPGKVTDPDGNYVLHTYGTSGGETRTEYFDATGTSLKRIDRTYSVPGTDPYGWYVAQAGYAGVTLKTIATSYPPYTNGPVSLVCMIYDGNSNTNCVGSDGFTSAATFYDENVGVSPTYPLIRGSLLYKYEYNYSGGSPTLVRQTVTNYKWQSSSAYLNRNLLTLPSSVIVCDGTAVPCTSANAAQTNYAYDESARSPSSCQTTPCGLLTTTTRYANGSTSFTSHTNYSSYGMPTDQFDQKGNHTCYTYDSTHAYLSEIQHPTPGSGTTCSTSLLEYFSYNMKTGLMSSYTDMNGRATAYGYDSMRRLTSVSYPDGGSDTYTYTDAIPNPYFTFSKLIQSGSNFVETGVVDGLGRRTQARITSDTAGTDTVDYAYDHVSRLSTVSNAHRSSSSPTDGTTTYHYDAANRITSVVEQDGSAVSTSYAGSAGTNPSTYCATVIDEASKGRKSCADGLGRVTSVWEDPSSSNYETDYAYNTLDNLTSVTQKGGASSGSWRTRTFGYDFLGRLTSASNPESGAINYVFDANGNLSTKTDARGTIITYCYDALNRMTGKRYAAASCPLSSFDFAYYYDSLSTWGYPSTNTIGRVTAETNGGNINHFMNYDSMGREYQSWDCLPSNCSANPSVGPYYSERDYNLFGDLKSFTYPSGRKLTYQYNNAAELTQVRFDSYSGIAVGYNYLSSATYAPTGSPTGFTLGSAVTETTGYNDRLQNCSFQILNGAFHWVDRKNNYYPTPGTGCAPGTGGNNGNVRSIIDNLQSNQTQNFSYDNLNRISQAYTTGTTSSRCFGENFTIDPWGNLSAISAITSPSYSTCMQDTLSGLLFGTNNRISGLTYDAAGDLLQPDIYHTYTYDAENRIATFNGTAAIYSYDADSKRVEKHVGSDITYYLYSGGQPIAELKTNGDWSDYIYAGSRRLARSDSYYDAMYTSGTNCSSCGWQTSSFGPSSAVYLNGYVIQTGDMLLMRQWQSAGARGGALLSFWDSTTTNGTAYDQDGQLMNSDNTTLGWHVRWFNLNAYAGKTVGYFNLVTDGNTLAGPWNIYYLDVVLVSSDGTVRPIFTGEQGISFTMAGTSGVTGRSAQILHTSGVGQYPDMTQFYHGNHLGSERLMTGYAGYPVWSAAYTPFGMEQSPQVSVNHYKFTGKERDSESGLDNFGARYDSSQYGRFMTPDPSGIWLANLTDPQQLNLYSYVRNNPLSFTDPTGLDCVYLNDAGNGVDDNGIDHNSNQGECWGNGGYWANGNVSGASSVQTDPNSNNIGIFSTDSNGNTGYSIAGQGWTQNPGSLSVSFMPSSVPSGRNTAPPTNNDYIRAIANAVPTVCGGGAFAFAGLGGEGGGTSGFVGAIGEYDSRSGWSRGILTEGGVGGQGVGHVSGPNGENQTFGFNEAYEVPGVVNGGLVHTDTAAGPYIEGEYGPLQFGGGAYANIKPAAQCHP